MGLLCQAPKMMQMHVLIERPLTNMSFGRISCRPVGREPIEFTWTGPGGREVQLDATRSEALAVTPGKYRIVARDANDTKADVVVEVSPHNSTSLVINEYRVTPPSTGTSRDGSVEALGLGLEGGWRFLWTNGVETDTPILRDVPCGVYAVHALPMMDRVPTLIHNCGPAYVRVVPLETELRL